MKSTQAEIIAVTNAKGGVGKTSTIVMLTKYQAIINMKRILIISLDRQCNLDTSVGFDDIKYRTLDNSSFELMTSDIDIRDCIKKTDVDNIDIVLSNYKMNKAHRVLYKSELEDNIPIEYILKYKLEPVLNEYDYIFLDSGANMDIIMINALVSADKVVIPINPDNYSQDTVQLLVNDIIEVKDKYNENLKISGIFLNKFINKDKHRKIHAELKGMLPNYICESVIYNRNAIADNIELRKDSFMSKSIEAKFILEQYKRLVEEVL